MRRCVPKNNNNKTQKFDRTTTTRHPFRIRSEQHKRRKQRWVTFSCEELYDVQHDCLPAPSKYSTEATCNVSHSTDCKISDHVLEALGFGDSMMGQRRLIYGISKFPEIEIPNSIKRQFFKFLDSGFRIPIFFRKQFSKIFLWMCVFLRSLF